MNLSADVVNELLRPYGWPATPDFASKIAAYVDILLLWNRKMSLTTVADPLEMLKFHFGESLFAIPNLEIDEKRESRLADVGSGAGFPGLPLAMALPSLKVTLIESNSKKCAFLSELVRKLAVPNADIHRGRMESYPNGGPFFDFVVARAFGQFDSLLEWAQLHLTAEGRLVLWLGEEDATELARRPGWLWRSPIRIPGTTRRVLQIATRQPL